MLNGKVFPEFEARLPLTGNGRNTISGAFGTSNTNGQQLHYGVIGLDTGTSVGAFALSAGLASGEIYSNKNTNGISRKTRIIGTSIGISADIGSLKMGTRFIGQATTSKKTKPGKSSGLITPSSSLYGFESGALYDKKLDENNYFGVGVKVKMTPRGNPNKHSQQARSFSQVLSMLHKLGNSEKTIFGEYGHRTDNGTILTVSGSYTSSDLSDRSTIQAGYNSQNMGISASLGRTVRKEWYGDPNSKDFSISATNHKWNSDQYITFSKENTEGIGSTNRASGGFSVNF
jgi:hypothetical protein